MVEIRVSDLSQLPGAAKEFLELTGDCKVFAFDAPMGAGKTTFILALLRALGIQDPEGSPTYSLVNTYQSPLVGTVYHFDVYRLEEETEALDFGIEEMLYGVGVCLIEWPEKIAGLLPDDVIWSYIRVNQDGSRTISIDL